MISRAFADLPGRQVHYRHAGTGGVPLLMLHASPASARQLEPLIGAMAASRRVIAPDRPGNGDSAPLPIAVPEIADYAAAELEFLDVLGIGQIDVYGSHTGAFVAAELAILAGPRVRRVILDGIALFSAEQTLDYLAHYAPEQEPDLAGLYLHWAFMFCRDQSLFFPWFKPRSECARPVGLPSAEALHAAVIDVLKSIRSYHLGYNASFRYGARERLPLVRQTVLAFCATDDPLLPYLDEAITAMPQASAQRVPSLRERGTIEHLTDLLSSFLDD